MRQVTGWSIAVAGALAMLATSSAIAQTPEKGGTLNFAVVAEPPNYDCHGSTTFALIHPIAPHYSLLVTARSIRKSSAIWRKAHTVPLLWWRRIIVNHKKIKGWNMTPSHYLDQDLVQVWLDG